MRQIKFRAWDKVEKKMCAIKVMTDEGCFLLGVKPGKGQFSDDGKLYIPAPKDGRFCYYENFELMQFTGLLDKNGVELYEGDIVKHPICETGKIIFFQPYTGFQVESRGLLYDLNLNNECEVIGNIFENPELINE